MKFRSEPFVKNFKLYVQGLAARWLVWLIGCLPVEGASALGGGLARLIGPLTRADRIARSNLARLLPAAQIPAVIDGVWDNIGRTLFEYPHLRRIIAEGRIEVVGVEYLQAAKAAGRGGLIASGHFANWEILPLMAADVGIDLTVMQRPPNNPHVQAVVNQCRPNERVTYVEKGRNGSRATFETLEKGGFFGFLMDQRFVRGVKVTFLNSDTWVAPTVGSLAHKFACPIFLCRCERTGPVRFRVTIEPPLAVDYTQSREAFQQHVAQMSMTMMEGWIKQRPSQWFWMHRLWR